MRRDRRRRALLRQRDRHPDPAHRGRRPGARHHRRRAARRHPARGRRQRQPLWGNAAPGIPIRTERQRHPPRRWWRRRSLRPRWSRHLQGGPDGDVLDGGDGLADAALYEEKASPVTVTIGDGANDGVTGEGNNVQTTVENVIGGQAPDTLTGDDDRNALTGNRGNDTLNGGVGADDLVGNAGVDRLFGGDNADLLSGLDDADQLLGGPGVDRFFGGADGDTIDARDAEIENQISCGEGVTTGRDEDRLLIDLRDAVPADCERVEQFATDDGPPGRALPQRLRVRRGRTVVKVRCPRAARVACRGLLTLRHPRSGRALGRGRYRVRRAGRGFVSVTVRRRLPRRVVAEMKEQGVSKKGPRFSSRLLRVSR